MSRTKSIFLEASELHNDFWQNTDEVIRLKVFTKLKNVDHCADVQSNIYI